MLAFFLSLAALSALLWGGAYHDNGHHGPPWTSGPSYHPIDEGCHFRDRSLVLCYRYAVLP